MKQYHLKIQFTYNPISVLLSRVDSFKTVQYGGNEHDRMPLLSTSRHSSNNETVI